MIAYRYAGSRHLVNHAHNSSSNPWGNAMLGVQIQVIATRGTFCRCHITQRVVPCWTRCPLTCNDGLSGMPQQNMQSVTKIIDEQMGILKAWRGSLPQTDQVQFVALSCILKRLHQHTTPFTGKHVAFSIPASVCQTMHSFPCSLYVACSSARHCQKWSFWMVMLFLRMLCRLFSSAHYNDTFPRHTPPEILNTPLEGVVLLLKAMSVDKVRPVLFVAHSHGLRASS